jgi:hypothetical protein
MTSTNRRPRTLAEVARRAAAGEQKFDPALLEFLDTFYANPDERSAAIAERPALLGGVYDPYLAAVAEHLARCHGLDIPPWSDSHGERLRKPFFAGGLESLKARLTVESPSAFRRRLIFVSHNALDRPRMLDRD